MKKNTMLRTASILLVAVLLTTCAISGTFAKYTSTAAGSDAARVAVWDIDVEGVGIETKSFTFDLFNTVLDTKDGNSETDVKVGTNETIIAPGTKGSFEINLTNASEVNATYDIAYTITNTAGIPLKFSTNGTTWETNIAQLNVTGEAIAMTNGAASITVYWQWDYTNGTTAGDEADTALGLDGTHTVTVTATVTATQVD